MSHFGCKQIFLLMGITTGVVLWGASIQPAQAASLRILMVDGTSLEVPFCWEEGGMVKFEMPGGNAGIPKSNIASIQEIITTGEFDPGVLVKSSIAARSAQNYKTLEGIVQAQTAPNPSYRPLSQEEAAQVLELKERRDATKEEENVRIITTNFRQQADFSDFVQVQGDGMLLVMRQILSSQGDLRNKRFTLTLYDAQGNVLQRKPCDISELTVDKKTLKQLGISGMLFSVVATVKPDDKIKRYEITSAL
jgi:hypothetical protein